MSTTAVSAVWKHSRSAGTPRFVLVALADEANDEGLVTAHRRSHSHVAGKCAVSPDTVARAVRTLTALGELEVLKVGSGRQQSDYRIVLPGLAEGVQSAVPPKTERARGRGGRGRASAGAPPAPVPPPSSRSYPGSNPNPSTSPAPPDDEPREEVVALCDLLQDRMIANDCKPPTITRSWLDAARLLLDRDERPLAEAAGLIRWATEDPFWRANIHSMPTFREKYDRLRLARQRPAATDQLDGLRQYREATNGQ